MKHFILLAIVIAAVGANAEETFRKAPASESVVVPKVSFAEPKDGATVPAKFKVVFKVTGMKVEKAGPLKPGTGHHHLLIDAGPVEKGQIVPKDETHMHFGGGQTEAEITLPPGKHTLTLQFADGAHASYGPDAAATITVNVK